MVIKKGDIIKVEYEGRLEDLTIFDSTELQGGKPMKFEVGVGLLIRGFDNSVVGKEVGNEFTPEPGMMLNAFDANGAQSVIWIKEVDDEFVTLDMNHPMAGKTLIFKIKILETGCEPDPPGTHECGCGCEHN
jgi:peptidylprolyl isomerase